MRRAPPEKKLKASKAKAKAKTKSKTYNAAIVDEDEIVQPPPTIIFCTRPKTVAYLTHFLKALDIRATALHSRLTQRERLNSLDLFRSSMIPVLVSTDVGARGLDIEGVALVVNWDMPTEPEEYTHRVGRTARKGRHGMAVSFVTERDEERVQKVEARIGMKLGSPKAMATQLMCFDVGTQLVEMTLPESKVLEPLNKVFTAQRVARLVVSPSGI
jgi:ATP-dependent RNA helicase DDX49/DBP8